MIFNSNNMSGVTDVRPFPFLLIEYSSILAVRRSVICIAIELNHHISSYRVKAIDIYAQFCEIQQPANCDSQFSKHDRKWGISEGSE